MVLSYGNHIKDVRKDLNLTQKQFAKKIGCAEITIRQYENGKRQPRLEVLQKIASTFDIPVSDLLPTAEELEAKNRELEQDIKGNISDEERLQKMNEHLTNSELKKEVTNSGWNELFPFYDSLNAAGKAKVKEYIQDLLCARQYQGMIHTKAIPFLNSKGAWSSLEQHHLEKKKD